MSPFKGQGANQALLDALSLARELYGSELCTAPAAANAEVAQKRQQQQQAGTDGGGSTSGGGGRGGGGGRARPAVAVPVAAALAAYEGEMLRRSAVKVELSAENARILHDPAALAPTRGQTRAAAARAALGGVDPLTLQHS